jgi:hypothetical protein
LVSPLLCSCCHCFAPFRPPCPLLLTCLISPFHVQESAAIGSQRRGDVVCLSRSRPPNPQRVVVDEPNGYTQRQGRQQRRRSVTKRTDPSPTSEVDSIFSLRDDEAGVAFKSTRDADADDNDDESRRTSETPKGDDGGANDSQRQSKAAPAETPRTSSETRGHPERRRRRCVRSSAPKQGGPGRNPPL